MSKCPNCGSPVQDHPENSCVLAALIGVLRDRAELTDERCAEIHANCNVDALWDKLGEIVDDLGEGYYIDYEEDEESSQESSQEQALIDELDAWWAERPHFAPVCALEAQFVYALALSREEKEYLTDFCRRWDQMRKDEELSEDAFKDDPDWVIGRCALKEHCTCKSYERITCKNWRERGPVP